MRNPRHPEVGSSKSEAQNSFFGLICITVALGGVINALINHFSSFSEGKKWTLILIFYILVILFLIFLAILWDDRRFGKKQICMELLIPYVITDHTIKIPRRKSYPVNEPLFQAWTSKFSSTGLKMERGDNDFLSLISPYHFDLIRYVLIKYLADYGKFVDWQSEIGGWLGSPLKSLNIPFDNWPEEIRQNPFIQSTIKCFPKNLILLSGCEVLVGKTTNSLLNLNWYLINKKIFRGIRYFLPNGQIRIRWMPPLELIKKYDKRYEEITDRFRKDFQSSEIIVISTRMTIDIDCHLNFTEQTSNFYDWALNFSRKLVLDMDIHEWWDYKLKRTLSDLDWKIGYIKKDQEPSIIERLDKLYK